MAATSFRRVPDGYRRPRRKIYGESPFGGSLPYGARALENEGIGTCGNLYPIFHC